MLVVGESEREMSSNPVSGQFPGCRQPVRGKGCCEVVSTIGIYRQQIGRPLPKLSASFDSPCLWTYDFSPLVRQAPPYYVIVEKPVARCAQSTFTSLANP